MEARVRARRQAPHRAPGAHGSEAARCGGEAVRVRVRVRVRVS